MTSEEQAEFNRTVAVASEWRRRAEVAEATIQGVRERLVGVRNASPVHARDDHSQNCFVCSLLKYIDPQPPGWTGKSCPKCKGSGESEDSRGIPCNCGACAGTGEEYRQ